MASVSCSEDLSCSICLTIFTDPVTLLCGHSFCRTCITEILNSQHQCPQCRTGTSILAESIQTNHILKSLAEKTKEAEKMEKEHRSERAEVDEWLCSEHDEKLKLFCVTDQQLTCIICRDGERHEGHKFKPVKEAAASLRQEMEKGIENLPADIHAIESQANSQREEITKTKEESHQLMTQICSQFEEMHQFLRKREDEIKEDLKHKEEDAVEKMSRRLNAIETALSESRELEGKVTSVLNITDPERFLKSWTESYSRTPEDLFRPRADDLKVVNTSLSLGPYESHLQFFMWKEMLQVIQPREEKLSLKSNSATITVSDDGRSLLCTNQQTNQYNYYEDYEYSQLYTSQRQRFKKSPLSTDHAFSVNEFISGQHYWEVEVGQRKYWELGVKDNFLKYDGKKYTTCSRNKITELTFGGRPRKIGIYLNCPSEKVSFYDADNMSHIHTMSSDLMPMPVSAYFKVAADPNRLTVCCY
ncbi:nuclear factor 7, ovary-like [Thunnus maccoyii]|uniref:nuclear factor 7, ovary-like n=1 Tax=Thunnus maccoyii TaxID=8240 RepID=UPI001C4B0882|nr:nuclear factor 7, ovary-like [Thunnus maccoyii]